MGSIGTFAVLTGGAIWLALKAAASDEGDDRTADDIISQEKKASIRRVFPGELLGKTLEEINQIAKDKKDPDRDAARRARKLLKDKRFDKEN